MERAPRPDERLPAGPTVSSFIVRVSRDGARAGVVERVRDGVKEPFARLTELGDVIQRLLSDARLPLGPHVPGADRDTGTAGH
jgi:hypothetical protein